MSFQNSGTTPDGQVFYRGDAIIVSRLSHQIAGHIAEIGESDGEIFVTANLMTGVLNTMGGAGAKKFPPVEYEGTGYRHQSTKLGRGESGSHEGMLLFCFSHETPNFATGGAPIPAGEVTQPVDVNTGNDPGRTQPLPVIAKPAEQVAEEEGVFAPADADKDGEVSRREAKEWKKNHPEG